MGACLGLILQLCLLRTFSQEVGSDTSTWGGDTCVPDDPLEALHSRNVIVKHDLLSSRAWNRKMKSGLTWRPASLRSCSEEVMHFSFP